MPHWSSLFKKAGLTTDGTHVYAHKGGMYFTTYLGTAGGTIAANRIVKPSGTDVVVATLQSRDAIGVNQSGAVVSTDEVVARVGRVQVVSAAPIAAGDRLKCAYLGRVITHVDADIASAVVVNDEAGIGFANQPANDGIEVVSDSAADTGTVTIIGTTNGADTVVVETVTLTGTDAVSTTKTDWGIVLAIKADAHAGTITVREASGNATIKTLATGTNSSGVVDVGDASFCGLLPQLVAGGASTKQIGLYGQRASDNTMVYDSQALNGTTEVLANVAFNYISEMYVGDLAGASVVDLKKPTEEDENNRIGFALEAASAEDETIWAVILGM